MRVFKTRNKKAIQIPDNDRYVIENLMTGQVNSFSSIRDSVAFTGEAENKTDLKLYTWCKDCKKWRPV